MELGAFVERVIDDGIEAARRDYADDEQKCAGAVDGFEACRGKTPVDLGLLLRDARASREESYRSGPAPKDYWFWRCRELEIEWVCNVLSAALLNEGREPIIPPTGRGLMKAADILGVGEAA